MNTYKMLLRCFVVASLTLPLTGCSLFRGDSKGTTAVKTSNGTLPVRREASNIVDLAQPTVEVSGDNVIVTGNVRVRGSINPDARVQISVVDRYGQLADQINAKLSETEQDKVMTYRVKFGPIPNRGASLLVAYEDYRPLATYSADYIGSGGSGGSAAGGAVRNPSGSGVNSRKSSGSGSVVSRGSGGGKMR